jgi:hypothetical protein
MFTFWNSKSYNTLRNQFKRQIANHASNAEEPAIQKQQQRLIKCAHNFIHAVDELNHFFYPLSSNPTPYLLRHGYNVYQTISASSLNNMTHLVHQIKHQRHFNKQLDWHRRQYMTYVVLGCLFLFKTAQTSMMSLAIALVCLTIGLDGLRCNHRLVSRQTFDAIEDFIKACDDQQYRDAENQHHIIHQKTSLKML